MNKLNTRIGTTEERICELENRSECDTERQKGDWRPMSSPNCKPWPTGLKKQSTKKPENGTKQNMRRGLHQGVQNWDWECE